MTAFDNQLEVLLGYLVVDVDNTVLAQVRLVSFLQPLVQVKFNEQGAPGIDLRQVGMLPSEEHTCCHEVIGTTICASISWNETFCFDSTPIVNNCAMYHWLQPCCVPVGQFLLEELGRLNWNGLSMTLFGLNEESGHILAQAPSEAKPQGVPLLVVEQDD